MYIFCSPILISDREFYKDPDRSRETANNIQEISVRVIESVEELAKNATNLLDFVNNNVMEELEVTDI